MFIPSLLEIKPITLMNTIWSVVFSSLLTLYNIVQVSHFVDSLVCMIVVVPQGASRGRVMVMFLIMSVKNVPLLMDKPLCSSPFAGCTFILQNPCEL